MKKLLLSALIGIVSFGAYAQKPSPMLLNPGNHTLILIDYEGQMAFPTKSIAIDQLRNNTAIVAGASRIFKVPAIITTVAEKSFSGPVFPELEEFYPQQVSGYIDRSTMNSWEDDKFYKAVVARGKKTLVMGGLWTSVCIVGPVLSAISEGYNVYVITDASGDLTREAHEMAIARMVQAGAHPITSMQYLLELQRDWARQDTYLPVNDLVVKYGGAYGIGVQYSRQMVKH
jgi:nicotinamidase-related amidase